MESGREAEKMQRPHNHSLNVKTDLALSNRRGKRRKWKTNTGMTQALHVNWELVDRTANSILEMQH